MRMNELELQPVQDRVCELSDGNPGAINVMCLGVTYFGTPFLDALEARSLRGSAVYVRYNDIHGRDLNAMYAALLEGATVEVLPSVAGADFLMQHFGPAERFREFGPGIDWRIGARVQVLAVQRIHLTSGDREGLIGEDALFGFIRARAAVVRFEPVNVT